MQLDAYDIAIIGGGFTLVGALISAVIANWLARDLAKRAAKREAGRRLLESLSPELSKFCPTRNISPGEIKKALCDAFFKHRQSMIEYSLYLTGNEKTNYLEKCNAYFEQGGSAHLFKRYQTEDGGKTFHEDMKLILEHIET